MNLLALRVASQYISKRVTAKWMRAVATPLPASFPKNEIGLMTEEEYLHFRNPEHKHHPSDSYDYELMDLNRDRSSFVGEWGSSYSDRVKVFRLPRGFQVTHQDETIAVIHNGVAYYDRPNEKKHIPRRVSDISGDNTDLEITSYKQVKYLSEVMPLISPIAELNRAEHPVVLQHILVAGEPLTVCAERQPELNKGVTLVILNPEGLIVAQASNEWGATLLAVVQEYRGKGLGKIIGKYWYEYNPSYESGGFTESGQRNALAQWRDRVREFSSRGWYTELIRQGRLSYQRAKEILSGIGKKPDNRPKPTKPEEVKPTGEILVYVDDDRISFVVYDSAFLEEPDEKFVHGYGFMRSSPHVGSFFFAIDYDRPFAVFVTRVALQMAKDNGEDLYDGEGYHDMLELDGIPGIVKEGDYIKITQNLAPLKALAQKERMVRKPVDPYEEKKDLLLELADSKWK